MRDVINTIGVGEGETGRRKKFHALSKPTSISRYRLLYTISGSFEPPEVEMEQVLPRAIVPTDLSIAYDCDEHYLSLMRKYWHARSVERGVQRALNQCRKTVRDSIWKARIEACKYLRPVIFYEKHLVRHSRFTYRYIKVRDGYRTVRRKVFLGYERVRACAVWYRRGKKHTRWYTKRVKRWSIFLETVPVFKRVKVFNGTKTWYSSERIPRVIKTRIVFNHNQWLDMKASDPRGINAFVEGAPEVQAKSSELKAAHKAVLRAAQDLMCYRKPDNGCVQYASTSDVDRSLRFSSKSDPHQLIDAVPLESVPPALFLQAGSGVRVPVPRVFTWMPGAYGRIRVVYEDGHTVVHYPRRDFSFGAISYIDGDQAAVAETTWRRIEAERWPLQRVPCRAAQSDSDATWGIRSALRDAGYEVLSGNIKPDDLNLVRSIAELKDFSETARSLKSLKDATKVPQSIKEKALALCERYFPRSKGKLASATLVAAAGYLLWKMAVEPTSQDIQKVANNWSTSLLTCKHELTRLIGSLTRSAPARVRSSWSYHPSEAQLPQLEDLPIPGPERVQMGQVTSFPEMEFDAQEGFRCVGFRLFIDDVEFGRCNADGRLVEFNQNLYMEHGLSGIAEKSPTLWCATHEHAGKVFMLMSKEELMRLSHQELQPFWQEEFTVENLGVIAKDLQAYAATLFDYSHLEETIWELIPFSFVVNWFLSTRQSVEKIQNLLSARLNDTWELRHHLWATHGVSTSYEYAPVSLFAQGYTVSGVSKVRIYTSENEDGSDERLACEGPIAANATCHLSRTIIKDDVRRGVVHPKLFRRGQLTMDEDFGELLTRLIPVINVHYNWGKALSSLAMLRSLIG